MHSCSEELDGREFDAIGVGCAVPGGGDVCGVIAAGSLSRFELCLCIPGASLEFDPAGVNGGDCNAGVAGEARGEAPAVERL